MEDLWTENTPRNFWRLLPDPSGDDWLEAYQKAFPVLGISQPIDDIEIASYLILGEGQYGARHWDISVLKRLYYFLKPILPRPLRNVLRRQSKNLFQSNSRLGWPIEDRYVNFQFEVVRQLMTLLGQTSMSFRHFWPQGHRFAFVLTHDIETNEGQRFVGKVADLEEQLGFRSSFNFVPESYEPDIGLMQELQERGFEVGVHGLKHDGKLFNSNRLFMKRAERINLYLREFNAVGFRTPLTIRNPYWMQALDVEYDLSFFDTDPYEPTPGGCMSIWPFTIGRFTELPYTLPQDSTMSTVMGETTPRIWLQKVDFIEQNWGMALLNSHPDYLLHSNNYKLYADFLENMRNKKDYWHALPREVARWWVKRSNQHTGEAAPLFKEGTLSMENGQIIIS